jgi:hypothetical protein
MAVSFASVASTTYAESTTVVVTKPTGLAVGDLMVAHIGVQSIDSTDSITPPSGWAEVQSNADGSMASALFTKVAVSGDVDASNFTFTSGNPAAVIAGAIYRITGAGGTPQVSGEFKANASDTPSFAVGITPAVADTLILLFVATRDADGGRTASNYAIATSNPSWTEGYDLTGTAGSGEDDYSLSSAYANRPQTSDTGNFSVSLGGGTNITDCIGQMMVIRPMVTSTIAESITLTEGVSLTQLLTITIAEAVALTEALSVTIGKWANQAKSALGSWVNLDKND